MPIPVKEKAESRLTAKALVYKTLKEWIVDGTLQPGEQIYDQEIAKYFSVSRTPVREAMQLLADQKLIEIQPGKESRVASFEPDELKKSYYMLAELHALALQFSWDALDEGDLSELKRINEAMKKPKNKENLHKSQSLDKEFHDVIVAKSGSDFLKAFTDTLHTQVLRVENLYFAEEDNYETSWKVHEKLIGAIEEGDLSAGQAAMRENWLRTLELVKAFPGEEA